MHDKESNGHKGSPDKGHQEQRNGVGGRKRGGNSWSISTHTYRTVSNFHEGLIFAIFACRETFTKINTAKYAVRIVRVTTEN